MILGNWSETKRAPYIAWTDELDDLLKKYHGEGKSFAKTAALMTADTGLEFTKNGCIGRGRRLGLEQRQPRKASRLKVVRTVDDRGVIQRIRTKKVAAPYVEAVAIDEPPSRNLTLIQLNETVCHYPHGESDFTFCGHPALEGGPYCASHAALCYRAPEARRAA